MTRYPVATAEQVKSMTQGILALLDTAAVLTKASDDDFEAAGALLFDGISVAWAYLAAALGLSEDAMDATLAAMRLRVVNCEAAIERKFGARPDPETTGAPTEEKP